LIDVKTALMPLKNRRLPASGKVYCFHSVGGDIPSRKRGWRIFTRYRIRKSISHYEIRDNQLGVV